MATLVIKNVPDHLHATLKLRAQRHHRSLAKEALTLLEQGMASAPQAAAPLPTPITLPGGPITIEEIESAINWGRE